MEVGPEEEDLCVYCLANLSGPSHQYVKILNLKEWVTYIPLERVWWSFGPYCPVHQGPLESQSWWHGCVFNFNWCNKSIDRPLNLFWVQGPHRSPLSWPLCEHIGAVHWRNWGFFKRRWSGFRGQGVRDKCSEFCWVIITCGCGCCESADQ